MKNIFDRPILTVHNLRRLLLKGFESTNVDRFVSIGHGFSVLVDITDGAVSFELGVKFLPDRHFDGSTFDKAANPIQKYIGGFSVALGEFAISDQDRDCAFQIGRNLLADFAYGAPIDEPPSWDVRHDSEHDCMLAEQATHCSLAEMSDNKVTLH